MTGCIITAFCIKEAEEEKHQEKKKQRLFFRDEEGFSTAGIVLALLITLSLIFSSAQVYQVNAHAATIQNVADAAVLAAENEVAEFSILAQVCDAVILSFSLTGISVIGLGIVALCTPATAALSDTLIKTGADIIKKRNAFAEKAASGLNRLQKILPFMSAARAESVMRANSGGAMDASYEGLAILLPGEGDEISVGPLEAADTFIEEVEKDREHVKKAAREAEEAAKKAKEVKEEAFLHDCGSYPQYCMRERAEHLAALPAHENPQYHSLDAWSFSVALKRAQSYYPSRLTSEVPADNSSKSRAESALRKRFYAYAVSEINKGYVHEKGTESFTAYFPLLPKNTDEMRKTELYTEAVYPITTGKTGASVMHAWNGCPGAETQVISAWGSLSDRDSGSFETCEHCEFSVANFGKIAAASSSIENGFEYHYRIVAEAAESYQRARAEYSPHAQEVQSFVGSLFDHAKEAFGEAISYRIKIAPPGKYGAVALVVNTQATAASKNFVSQFVKSEGVLGLQVALSASTLVGDSAEEGANVISSLLDGVASKGEGQGLGVIEGVLDLWSSLLLTYTKGQAALEEGISQALGALPLASESGLGTWAARTFSDFLNTVGLEPADLSALKPVLLNTAHVLSADDSAFSKGLMGIKKSYLSLEGSGSGTLFSAAITHLEKYALESIEEYGDEIAIASIELFEGSGFSIPLTIALPPSIKGAASNLITRAADFLRGVEAEAVGVRRWE